MNTIEFFYKQKVCILNRQPHGFEINFTYFWLIILVTGPFVFLNEKEKETFKDLSQNC